MPPLTYGRLAEAAGDPATAAVRARVCDMLRSGAIGAADENGCRPWTGRTKKGQPEAKIGGKRVGILPHLFRAWRGVQPPKGATITRSCGNTTCAAPEHLACEIYSARAEDEATRERLQERAALERVTLAQVRSQRTASARTLHGRAVSDGDVAEMRRRAEQEPESYCQQCCRLKHTCRTQGCDAGKWQSGLGHTAHAARRPHVPRGQGGLHKNRRVRG